MRQRRLHRRVPQIHLWMQANGLPCLSSSTRCSDIAVDIALQPMNSSAQTVVLIRKCVVHFVKSGVQIQRQTSLHHLQMMQYRQYSPERWLIYSRGEQKSRHFDEPDSSAALTATSRRPY